MKKVLLITLSIVLVSVVTGQTITVKEAMSLIGQSKDILFKKVRAKGYIYKGMDLDFHNFSKNELYAVSELTVGLRNNACNVISWSVSVLHASNTMGDVLNAGFQLNEEASSGFIQAFEHMGKGIVLTLIDKSSYNNMIVVSIGRMASSEQRRQMPTSNSGRSAAPKAVFSSRAPEAIQQRKREDEEHLRQMKEENEFKTTWYDLRKYDTAAYNEFVESIKFQINRYLDKELPNFISLRYRMKYNGSIEFNNSYHMSYKLEDRSTKSEIRGNTIITGSNKIVTNYSCTLINGSDSGCIVARNFQVGLPMVKINGKKWLSRVVVDTVSIKFIRGITEMKCGKKGYEFTRFEPKNHFIKDKIISMASGKKGQFIVEYEIRDIWGDIVDNITFKPYERL